MTDYLLRLTEPDATLLLFTDEEDFTCYLAEIIAVAHESGLGPLIAGIWCWDEQDDRHELEISYRGEDHDPDGWMDRYYEVRRKDGEEGVRLQFTAQIDEKRTDD